MGARTVNRNPYSRYFAAAFAFLFDRDGRFLLLRERSDDRKYMFDLPGGTLTDQEKPVSGLMREVAEETGLRIRLLSPLCWLKWDRHDSGEPILVAFYVAEADSTTVSLSEEHVGYRWVSMEELRLEGLELSAEKEIIEACFEQYTSCRRP